MSDIKKQERSKNGIRPGRKNRHITSTVLCGRPLQVYCFQKVAATDFSRATCCGNKSLSERQTYYASCVSGFLDFEKR